MAQHIAQQRNDGPRQHQTDGPRPAGDQLPRLMGRLQPAGKQPPLDEVDHRGQQVSQHAADDHRLERAQQLTAEGR